MMDEYGVTAEDFRFYTIATFTSAIPAKDRAKGEPKYANPANPSGTYAGGRSTKPKWMRE